MKTKDVAIVIGHDWASKGAFSSMIGQSEYDYNKEVAMLLGCDVFTHSPNYSYRKKMKATYRALSHYDVTLELHYNAAANTSAGGAEALYFHTNNQGSQIASLFSDMVSKEYGIRNRGAKPLSNTNQRGYWAVASGIPTGLILEPFFGTNSEASMFTDKCRYAEVLRRFISEI